ncbi:MAG: TraB/GumN family protein, partial [Novosphingobium sp.]
IGALGLALLGALALAGCKPAPVPAKPALWEVSGPKGERAWLFGTIHALPRPAAWRSPAIDRALGDADRIVVEIAEVGDGGAMQRTFAALATTPGQPALASKLPPELRGKLAAELKAAGLDESRFADLETWAAALTLAQAGAKDMDSANGIDRAVIALAGQRPVIELEGTRGQLGIFDALPEAEQRDLLAAVVADPEQQGESPTDAWLKGDMAAIERETHRGLLADPELRQALFSGRNKAWTDKIAAMLAAGQRPFVAVGGAHMAGSEGLPALLGARGYQVRRVQ